MIFLRLVDDAQVIVPGGLVRFEGQGHAIRFPGCLHPPELAVAVCKGGMGIGILEIYLGGFL